MLQMTIPMKRMAFGIWAERNALSALHFVRIRRRAGIEQEQGRNRAGTGQEQGRNKEQSRNRAGTEQEQGRNRAGIEQE